MKNTFAKLRRSVYVAVAAAAVVMILAIFANSQGPTSNENQFWGTWLHQVQGLGPNGEPGPALVTFHFDGTAIVSSGFMFGLGSPLRLSPIHAVWEKTGPKRVAVTSLFFVFDGNGVLTGYQRNRCPLTFSDDSNHYEGTEFMETVSCPTPWTCPDPLDPTTTWTPMGPSSGFTVSGSRLKWVPPPA